MSQPSLSDKLALFDSLEALDNEDSDDDYGNNEREIEYREKTRAFFTNMTGRSAAPRRTSPIVNRTAAQNSSPLPPRRTISEPTPKNQTVAETPRPTVIKDTPLSRKAVTAAWDSVDSRTDQGDSTLVIKDTPVPNPAKAKNYPSLQRGSTYPGPSSAGSNMKKRKRSALSSTKLLPESEHIFRGLAFYYIPDNDVAPVRKIRIGRAREHGAQWIRSLDQATHIIVDKKLTYRDIEPILAKASGSLPVIVNEDYPIDCITFRTLLNPDQQRYRVAGCPVSTQNNTSNPADAQQQSQTPNRSLEVEKHPRRMTSGPLRGTPPRSEESRPRSPGNEQANVTRTSEIFDEPVNIEEEEDAIEVIPASPLNNGSLQADPMAYTRFQRKDSSNDELSEYISLIQQYKDLPLDDDNDDEDDVRSITGGSSHDPVSDVEPDSDSSPASSHTRKKQRGKKGVKPASKTIAFEERFACHQGGTKDSSAVANPNARIIEVLQSMCDYYSRTNDHWRTTAYRKAISTLRRQTAKITTQDEAYRLPSIGRRLAAKIEEIATTDRLRRLECAAEDPLAPVLELFLGIYDVGLATARKWIAEGHRTLDDLLAKVDLTANQRIGVERYEDLNTRIPRGEVEALAAYVRRAARALEPAVELLVGGSYRRGADSSGDIDFIVTKKGTESADALAPFLAALVARLTDQGFLVATLSARRSSASSAEGGGGSKWHGCCVLPAAEGRAALGKSFRPRWRRIDFLLVPETEYGAALIYFTGNDIFNRSIRLLASKKGMRLNQRGLYREVMRGPGRVKVTEGELVEGRDERRIFEILGVKWREPRERWC